MHPGRIEGATRRIGAPEGWDADKEGPCGFLHVRDMPTVSGNCMITAWFPTPEELAAIFHGAPIYLSILGERHPVISMGVGNAPADD